MKEFSDTIAAADAKTHFGALLDKAQQGPVTISKNWRAVAVVMSMAEYEAHQNAKLHILREEVRKGVESLKIGGAVRSANVFAELDKALGD